MEQLRTRKVRKRQNQRIKRIAALVMLLAVVAVFIGWMIMRRTATGEVFSSQINLPFYTQDTFLSNSKAIVYKKGTSVTGLDAKGRELFSVTGVAEDAGIRLSEDYLCIYGKNYYDVYSMAGKHVTKYETDDTIYDVRMGEGYVALVKADPYGNTYLVLNDNKSGQLYSTGVDTNNLLDFGVVSTSETLWTMSINTQITTPLCVFTTYNTKRKSVSGVINIAEQLVERVIVNSDKVYAIGTSNMVVYSLSGQKEETYLTYGWKITDWLFVGGKPYFVLVPRTDDPITSVRIRHSDATEYTFTLQEECSEVIIGKDKVYALNENNIFYTDMKGENIQKTETPFKIKSCTSVFGGSHIIADDGSGYSLLSLK